MTQVFPKKKLKDLPLILKNHIIFQTDKSSVALSLKIVELVAIGEISVGGYFILLLLWSGKTYKVYQTTLYCITLLPKFV